MLRELKIIEVLAERNGLELLTAQQYKNLLVIQELYRQQFEMYEHRQYRQEDRIVSIRQPHVRPIVRGKAATSVEFGAKLSVSVVNGFIFCRKLGGMLTMKQIP